MRFTLRATLIVLTYLSTSFAAGFGLYEFGARSSALAGAVVAQARDASTIFYNPAGLAFLTGSNFYGGTTIIHSSNAWKGPTPYYNDQVYEAEHAYHTPLGIYFSHRFSDRLAAGIGLTNPFGLGLGWPDDFPGRIISKHTDLKSFYFSPVLSYRLFPNLSIGAGIDIVYSKVSLERHIFFAFPDDPSTLPGVEVGELLLEADSKIAYGFAVSSLFNVNKLSLGFLYRHQIKNKFEKGDAIFTLYDLSYKNFLQGLGLKNQRGETEITYPSFISVGAHYQLTEKLGLEADYMWYKWSVFKELSLDFEEDALDATVEEDYSNTWQFRVCTHYNLTPNLELRLGYIYDKTPQPVGSVSPILPDNNRNDYSIGVGYRLGSMTFDVGYMLVDFGTRSTIVNGEGQQFDGFDGVYSSVANLFLLSYGISF
jgi:long-chain fatty acid transport protein